MSRGWVEHYPRANPELLFTVERFFTQQLAIYPTLEAIILFASALLKFQPGDVDFFIVSDDSSLKATAMRWISMQHDDYWHPEFNPDFFFRVSTSLNPKSIDGKRDFDPEIFQSIQDYRQCVVFTRKPHVQKYLKNFPNSFVVQTHT